MSPLHQNPASLGKQPAGCTAQGPGPGPVSVSSGTGGSGPAAGRPACPLQLGIPEASGPGPVLCPDPTAGRSPPASGPGLPSCGVAAPIGEPLIPVGSEAPARSPRGDLAAWAAAVPSCGGGTDSARLPTPREQDLTGGAATEASSQARGAGGGSLSSCRGSPVCWGRGDPRRAPASQLDVTSGRRANPAPGPGEQRGAPREEGCWPSPPTCQTGSGPDKGPGHPCAGGPRGRCPATSPQPPGIQG